MRIEKEVDSSTPYLYKAAATGQALNSAEIKFYHINDAGQEVCYYTVFTPLSTLLGNWLVETCGWNEYLVTIMNMLLNFVTEYLFDTFVVFRGSMDTNDLAKKEEQK